MVSIARAFEEISDAQSRAELEARLDLLEERMERLASRRDEVDQAIHSELNVMRTRIESALEAAGPAIARRTPGQVTSGVGPVAIPGNAPPALPEPYRKEIERQLLQARSDLRFEIFGLQKQLEESLSSPQRCQDLKSTAQGGRIDLGPIQLPRVHFRGDSGQSGPPRT